MIIWFTSKPKQSGLKKRLRRRFKIMPIENKALLKAKNPRVVIRTYDRLKRPKGVNQYKKKPQYP